MVPSSSEVHLWHEIFVLNVQQQKAAMTPITYIALLASGMVSLSFMVTVTCKMPFSLQAGVSCFRRCADHD